MRKRVELIGNFAVIASLLAITCISDQIRLNLSGVKGSVIFPAMVITCNSLWLSYLTVKGGKDWRIIVVNVYGCLMQFINLITAGM